MNFSGLTRVWQILRWGVVAMAAFICFQSGSRGQTLALFIVLVIFLPLSRRIRNIQGFVATMVSIGLVALVASWGFDQLTEAQGKRWDLDRMLVHYETGRFDPAMRLLTVWGDSNPLRWIIGLGSAASFAPEIIGFYPHLVPLEVLGELGVIGFVLFLVIIVRTFLLVKRSSGYVTQDPPLRGLVATIGGLFLFEFILCFKQGSLLGSTNLFAFAILVGTLHRSFVVSAAQREAMGEWYDEPALDDESCPHEPYRGEVASY